MVSIIVAATQNSVIGKDNKLLWRLSADLKHFKNLTSNHVLIMGRKTYDSIGKPLPNRISIIISRQKHLFIEGCICCDSLLKAIAIAQNLRPNEEVFVIGGGEIYSQALAIADKIYLTEVQTTLVGDAFFPKIDKEQWLELSRVAYASDEKNEYNYDFVELLRKNPLALESI